MPDTSGHWNSRGLENSEKLCQRSARVDYGSFHTQHFRLPGELCVAGPSSDGLLTDLAPDLENPEAY
jgi:hypothetical protein